MIGTVIAERYAAALFAVAKRQGVQSEIERHLSLIKGLFQESMFRRLLDSPKIRPDDKMASLKRGLDGLVNPLVFRLLALLLERQRANQIPAISDAFTRMLEDEEGIARAKVYSAFPLDGGLERALMKVLENLTDKKILMEKYVDPSLIGGVMVRVGDNLIDNSIRTQLKEMREGLLATKVR